MQGTFQSWKTWLNTIGITIYKLYFTDLESHAI